MPARRRWAGVRRTLAATAGAAVAVLASGGPAGASGLEHLTADAASELYVAVVVDFGGANGAPGNFATCVKVPEGSTDADALAAAVGKSNLGYAPSGLLCVIDGVPQSGVADCNATSDGEYYFWSYWNGTTGSWSYASKGPASTLVLPGDVEGWRFQSPGPASPAAPRPVIAPTFSRICPAEYVTSPATTTTSPHPSTGVTAPSGPGSKTPPPVSPASGSHPAAASGTGGSPGSGPATTTTSPARSTPGHTTTTIPSSSKGRGPPAPSTDATANGSAHALGRVPHVRSSSNGWLVPLLVGLLVIGLGIAAAVRWRRRPGSNGPIDP